MTGTIFDADNEGCNDNYDDNYGVLMIIMTKMTKKTYNYCEV